MQQIDLIAQEVLNNDAALQSCKPSSNEKSFVADLPTHNIPTTRSDVVVAFHDEEARLNRLRHDMHAFDTSIVIIDLR